VGNINLTGITFGYDNTTPQQTRMLIAKKKEYGIWTMIPYTNNLKAISPFSFLSIFPSSFYTLL